jgi:AcrR family transcriptional regulator
MSSTTTREQLLETAWRLFQSDPAAASMGRIAAEAGVSRQAVYLHFQSRAGLLLALVRWIDERERIAAQFEVAARQPAPLAVLEAQIQVWLHYLPRLHPVPSFLARFDADPEARSAWNDRMTELEKIYRRPLRALQRAGELREGLSLEHSVDLVRGLASVHAWHYLVHESSWKQEAAVHAILSAVRGALLPAIR